MNTRALNRATLARQMLLQRERVKVTTAIERIGGMQAQVPKPPFLGLWSRIEDFDRDELRKAIARGDVVRATLNRGTIHLVTKKDLAAWRPLFQPALTSIALGLTKQRPVDVDTVVAAARKFFAKQPATFEALRDHLAPLFPKFDPRLMAYTVRMHLPLTLVPDESPWSWPASAAFALAEEGRAAKPTDLVLRYLAAFGPATPADFQSWTGLKGAAPLFDELRPKLTTFRDGKRELFDLPDAPRPDEDAEAPVRLLPEFDSVLLAHADRRRIIADEDRPRIATKNLRIPAVFLVDGFVAGTWTIEKKKVALAPFRKLPKKVLSELEEEGERLLTLLR